MAADTLNGATTVAVLAGQGALTARAEVESLAEVLAAPVAKSLLDKAGPRRRFPLHHRRHRPSRYGASHWAMHSCDAVLILGSTMPWIDSYPEPGQAKGVQIDIAPERLGLAIPRTSVSSAT